MSNSKYETIPDPKIVEKLAVALKERNIEPIIVENAAQALEKIKELIPANSQVMNGSSTTLEQIGFVDYLKSGKHGWNNLKEAIVAEKDPVKQTELRKQSISADYFLGSVHAITEDGQLLIASLTGSQLPSYAFSSQNVIWVVGTHKIVPTLDDAFTRLKTYVFPLEDQHMKNLYGSGSSINKMLIFEREVAFLQRKIRIILVNERLGF
jgi:L-lactate utilization protein LutC